jgi:hypothetical protein
VTSATPFSRALRRHSAAARALDSVAQTSIPGASASTTGTTP